MLSNRKSRRAGQGRPSRTRFDASVEVFEKRELLSASGIGPFIQGTVFVDSSATGTLTGSDPTLSGVTVSLYQGANPNLSTASPIATTTTNASGNYSFYNNGTTGSTSALVADATYTVVESTPTNYASSAAQALSQVDPAKVVAPNEIQVTVVSAQETATYNSNVTYTPANLDGSTIDGLDYAVNGVQQEQAFATQLNFNVSGDSNDLSSSFNTFCVDPTDDLVGPPAKFAVTTDPTTAFASNGGEIGYLYDQYGISLPSTLPKGVSGLPTPDVEAGLQIAIWELEYPSTSTSAGFVLNGYDSGKLTAQDYADVQSAAAGFIADASGKSEQVGILDASLTGSAPADAAPNSGGQSILFGQSLNFGNVSAPPPAVSSISGTVYADNNANDTLDSGDTGLGGVTVYLYNGAGTSVIASTTSASNGTYSFNNLQAGQYNLVEYTPSGYIGETPTAGTSGGTPTNIASYGLEFVTVVPLAAGTSDTGNNFGQYKTGSLSGTVFVDATNSGSFVSSDATLSGITVTLETTSGTPITTATTGTGGAYSFTGLTPGTYKVVEGTVSGYSPDVTNTGSLSPITVTGGANTPNNNFGEVGQSSISGTVYVDSTGIGLTSAGQPAGAGDTGEAGVTVTLTEANGTKLTTTTASNGTYSFTGLPYGTYGISESVPSNQYQTGPAALTYSVTTSSTAPSSTNDNFSNYMACNMSGLDAYYFTITTPSGSSTNVTNLGGNVAQGDTVTAYFNIAPGSAPVMLSLVAYQAPTSYYSPSNVYEQVITSVSTGTYGPGNYSETVTIPNSYFQVDFVCGAALSQLELNGAPTDYNYENRLISAANGGTQAYALSSISGTVYADNNSNDTLDSGDTGLGGVQVFLYNAAGTQRLATTTTASNGSYSFSNLTPATYVVAEFVPSGYNVENPNAGSIGGIVSSSTSSGLAVINSINLNSNTNATNYNFGALSPVSSISGTVYADANRNDTFDSGDTGIGGVQVFLYNAAGTQRLATTTTASNGSYTFSNVAPGTYQVAEFAPGSYTVENPNAGTSGGSVSSSTSSGLAVIGSITIGGGVSDTGNNFGNLPQLATANSLCGIVYADVNYNDVYNQCIDYGIAGVTVTLSGKTSYGANYTLTTTTDCNGNYCFNNVVIGTYTITTTEPSGYTPEASNVGNAGGVIGLGSTSAVNLTAGAVDSGYNFGSKVNNCSLGNYQTCSTNFWCGSSGQSLLNCMNGSSNSTKLGNWLSSMLPNICGSFAGQTNAQVCNSFQWLNLTNSCNANIVSTALAAYCTNTSLAGCSTAQNYGFTLSNCGSGNCTVNLGNTFAGYGGPCGTTSLFQFLSFANSQSSSWSSWNWNSSQSAVSSWFSTINGCSKIG